MKLTKKDESIFTGKAAQDDLTKVRTTYPVFGIDDKANINLAFQAYEQEPTLKKLIDLYDTITYWEVLNNIYADQDWFQSVKLLTGSLRDSIKDEINLKTKNQFGTKHDLNALEDDTKNRNNEDQEWRALMPDYMKKLGIAPRYFHKHLMDYPERLENLQKFYEGLQTGALKDAETTYKLISDVPGMYLIKPLIVHHFAATAGLGTLVGTQAQQNGELTDEEIKAIETYSSGEYVSMNADLRATGSMPVLSNDDAPMDINQFDSFLSWHETLGTRKTARKTASELAVSGMNKLPPFKGIAYRALVWQPGGYFDVIQPGAMIVDLAFQSASPSLNGVKAFLDTQTGTKHVYFMVHTKSAVNIMAYAELAKEGEVLFRPGAKFQVKAVWHHDARGKVPPNAPAEAQMILHKQGMEKTAGLLDANGYPTSKMSGTGFNKQEAAESYSPDEIGQMQWHQVKVIEMNEV
jgi:hypothetical protein